MLSSSQEIAILQLTENFTFVAVAQCLKKKTRSSNLRCKPEKVEVDRTIDDSMKQLLKARNIPLFISSMAIETLGKVVKCVQILQNIIKF